MSLATYFQKLLDRVEASEIGNDGTDQNGFFKPTRALLVRHLNLLKDLHGKPMAKSMVKASWEFVVSEVPPDWLVLNPEEKAELQKILQ